MRVPRAAWRRKPPEGRFFRAIAALGAGCGDATLRAVNFGTWHELGDAPSVAPADPGVLQARATALRPYPAGRSAMIFYGASGASETLRAYVAGSAGAAALGRARALGASLVRFGVTATPEADLDRLLRGFAERFGAPPAANESSFPSSPAKNGATRDV
jgi:hypothetical protein